MSASGTPPASCPHKNAIKINVKIKTLLKTFAREMQTKMHLALLLVFALITRAHATGQEEMALKYLSRFGYLDRQLLPYVRPSSRMAHDLVKDFQRVAGINETGTLDKSTLAEMSKVNNEFTYVITLYFCHNNKSI